MAEIRDKGIELGEKIETKMAVEDSVKRIKWPDDSGKKIYKSELPDDSGDFPPPLPWRDKVARWDEDPFPNVTDQANEIDGDKASTPVWMQAKEISTERPTPRESEIKAKEIYGGEEQVAYKNGEIIRYGTPGSTRPDLVVTDPETGKITAIEVKNYDLNQDENVGQMYKELHRQVEDRNNNMPEGTEQLIVLDIRGQDLPSGRLEEVVGKIGESLKDIYPNIQIDIIE